MKQVMFVVRDSATGQYGPPLCFVSSGQAIRWFTDIVNSPGDSQYYMHPDDFEMFSIGEYDTETAGTQLHPPLTVCRARDVAIRS